MRFPLELPIAGLYYHYKKTMPNRMVGYIKSEPNNPHDSNAIGIYNADFGLIGYIPKDSTALVRAWSNTVNPELNCEINLSVEPDYDRYLGNVLIVDNIEKTVSNNPFFGKKICINLNYLNRLAIKHVVENLGGEPRSSISKLSDYYIYENEIEDSVRSKIGIDGYHFETMSLSEFIQKVIPPKKRNPLIYGHVITPSSVGESQFDYYLENFIKFEGGIYRRSYSKKYTEFVVLKTNRTTKISTKAESEGKRIIRCSDLMPNLYPIISRLASENVQSQSERTLRLVVEDFNSSPTSPYHKAPNEDNAGKNNSIGCAITVFIIGGLLSASLIL